VRAARKAKSVEKLDLTPALSSRRGRNIRRPTGKSASASARQPKTKDRRLLFPLPPGEDQGEGHSPNKLHIPIRSLTLDSWPTSNAPANSAGRKPGRKN
jgi:hypothetical protein